MVLLKASSVWNTCDLLSLIGLQLALIVVQPLECLALTLYLPGSPTPSLFFSLSQPCDLLPLCVWGIRNPVESGVLLFPNSMHWRCFKEEATWEIMCSCGCEGRDYSPKPIETALKDVTEGSSAGSWPQSSRWKSDCHRHKQQGVPWTAKKAAQRGKQCWTREFREASSIYISSPLKCHFSEKLLRSENLGK